MLARMTECEELHRHCYQDDRERERPRTTNKIEPFVICKEEKSEEFVNKSRSPFVKQKEKEWCFISPSLWCADATNQIL